MAQQQFQVVGNASVVFAGTAAFSVSGTMVLSGSAAFRVSGTIAVSGFTRLWSYRCRRQIVAMERKEIITIAL